MIDRGKKAFRPWIFLYAGFVAAIALANEKPHMSFSETQDLSPVTLGADSTALKIDALVRRSDI